MLNSRHIKTAIIVIAVMCLVYPAFSGDKKGPNGPKVITGEVVEIHRATQAAHGQIDEIVVGDGEGQRWRMRLLTPEGVPGAYQVGDMVRARVMWEDPADIEEPTDGTTETAVMRSETDSGKVALVRNMRNWRTGEKTVYRDGQGNLIQNKHAFQNKFQGKAEDGGHAVKTQWRQSGSGTSSGSGGGARQGGGGGGGHR